MNNQYGIIYKATCIINNKSYIGQTIQSLNERINKHYYKAKIIDNYNTHFLNALNKYDKKDFIWEIIDYANTQLELDEKEKYWIDYYDTINNGYNIRSGGETRQDSDAFAKACGSQPFLLFNSTGEFIGEFINKREVERKYHINHSDISQMIQNNKGFSNGYIAFDKQNFSQEKLEKKIQTYQKSKGIYNKPFICIDKNNNQYGPFLSKKEAELKLNIKFKHISEVLNKKRKTDNGFKIKYIEE